MASMAPGVDGAIRVARFVDAYSEHCADTLCPGCPPVGFQVAVGVSDLIAEGAQGNEG
jgi:hypothetical protein